MTLLELVSLKVTLLGSYEHAMQRRLCKNQQASKFKGSVQAESDFRRADFA